LPTAALGDFYPVINLSWMKFMRCEACEYIRAALILNVAPILGGLPGNVFAPPGVILIEQPCLQSNAIR
jgi:hypothetical protein